MITPLTSGLSSHITVILVWDFLGWVRMSVMWPAPLLSSDHHAWHSKLPAHPQLPEQTSFTQTDSGEACVCVCTCVCVFLRACVLLYMCLYSVSLQCKTVRVCVCVSLHLHVHCCFTLFAYVRLKDCATPAPADAREVRLRLRPLRWPIPAVSGAGSVFPKRWHPPRHQPGWPQLVAGLQGRGRGQPAPGWTHPRYQFLNVNRKN